MERGKKNARWLVALSCVTIMLALSPCAVSAYEKIVSTESNEATEESVLENGFAEEVEGVTKCLITWPFNIYEEPSFTAKCVAQFLPQEVLVVESDASGWGLISTESGLYWTYLKGDVLYINQQTALFNDKNGEKSGASLVPQVVHVVERSGDWLCIETWIGEKWINLKDADSSGDEKPNVATKHLIPWLFTIYDEPSFTANRVARFLPQEVSIIEENDNGWGLISTDFGLYWTYLKEDRIYIHQHTTLFDEKNGGRPVGSLVPQVVCVIARDGNWLLIQTWIGEKWINTDAIRVSIQLDVPLLNQRALGYWTGCEIVSLGMMVNYETDVNIKTLVFKMPRSNDPTKGFRGDVKTKSGFTILPTALMELVKEYLGQAKNMTGCSMEDLKVQLNANRPIVVWVNGLGFNVHAVCLTGYNQSGFYYNDPWTGVKNTFILYEGFSAIWNKPIYDGNLRVSYPVRLALSY